jgi:hypothetical protein
MIIDNSCLGLANTQDERFTPFLVIKIKGNDLTFGLGLLSSKVFPEENLWQW